MKFIASLVHNMLHLVENKNSTDSRLALVGCFLSIFSLKIAKTCAKCSFNQLLNCLFVQICHAHTLATLHSTAQGTNGSGKGRLAKEVLGTVLCLWNTDVRVVGKATQQ